MDQVSIDGWCDPRFAAFREQFALNFAERGETGGAVSVTVHGTVVADLIGGWADPQGRRSWAADTLVSVFSVGKGLVAACLARLAGQGLLDPDGLRHRARVTMAGIARASFPAVS